MTLPRGFRYRTYAIRATIDWPLAEGEALAAEVGEIIAAERERTGEAPSSSSVLRRAIRAGMPAIRTNKTTGDAG